MHPVIRGENLAKDLRRDHAFVQAGRTRDGNTVITRKGSRWTVVRLTRLTQEAVDIRAQAGVSLA
ncbi:hypothetical protein [Streptomyces sp. NPDC003077]|uniref:hypothetical protein n=1 Tax=Streptomyces sp. NPDC003077 TaxID=3154443 RepID=UPI0033AB8E67